MIVAQSALITQQATTIAEQSATIAEQSATIARHDAFINKLEMHGLADIGLDTHISKKTRLDEGPDTSLLTEAKAACAVLFANCTFVDQTPKVTLAKLKPEFEAVLKQPEKSLMLNWDRLYKTAKAQLKNDAKFLATFASCDLMFTNALLRKSVTGQFYSDSFGGITDVAALKHYVCLTHFAPPVASSTLSAARAQAIAELNDQSFGQSDNHLTKKETSLFGQGPFDTDIDTVLGCVANFLVFADIVVGIHPSWGHHQDNPLIVNLLMKLTGLFMNHQARNRVKLIMLSTPHLVFNIFCGIQDILGSFGSILMETTAILDVRRNENFDDTTFSTPYMIYEQRYKKFNDFVTFAVQGDLSSAYPSYLIFHPPAATTRVPIEESKQDAGKGKTKPSNTNKGKDQAPEIEQGNWLTAEPGVNISQAGKFDGFPFCRNHAFTNLTCKIATCKHPHYKWGKLPADKKALLQAYVASTDNTFRLVK